MTQNNGAGNHADQNPAARRAGRHARRVSYRGSDDYVVSEVGSPTTVPLDDGADLSGFDRMVFEHAAQDISVETVGKADPFEPDPVENYTQPFTTAFPDADRTAVMSQHGYSAFADIAEGGAFAAGGARSGQTIRQRPIQVEQVGAPRSNAGMHQERAGERAYSPSADGRRARNNALSGLPEFGEETASSATGKKKGKKPRKKGKRILIAVIAIIVCILAAIFIYMHVLDSTLSRSEGESASAALTTVSLDEPFYVLVMGGDSATDEASASGEPTGQRADVIMLVRVDAKKKVVTMVSIPRDTPYTWPDGSVTKINDCYYYGGAEATIRAVSELTGVDISHYATLSFDDLDDIVDSLGGVTVNLDTPIDQWMEGRHVVMDAGEQQANGLQALAFARSRHNYDDDQEAHRQSNVRALAQAIIDKTMSKSPIELPGTVLNLAHYVSTDLRSGDFINLAMAFGGNTSGMTVYNGTGPTDGDIMEEYGGYWYCYPNPEGWARLMEVVDAGEDPSGIEY